MIVGIEFGTCFSHVSVIWGGGKLDSDIVKADGCNVIPSRYLKLDDVEYYGVMAEEKARGCPEREVRGMNLLVKKNPDNLNYLKVPDDDGELLRDVVYKYIKYLLDAAVESTNEEIEYVAITMPAGITRGGQQSTDYAQFLKSTVCRISGLKEDRVFVKQEPVAAAFSYIYDYKGDEPLNVFVFDLGGGTLDVAVVSYDPSSGSAVVKATDGDSYLGGRLWTGKLTEILKREVQKKQTLKDGEFEKYLKKEDIKEAKKLLSDNDSVIVYWDDKPYEMSRALFEAETSGLLYRCMKVVDRVMDSLRQDDDARIDSFADIDRIVLVGDGSNMPQIRNAFLTYSGVDESKVVHLPSKAISRGAALMARREGVETGPAMVDSAFEEVAAHSYGVELGHPDDPSKLVIHNLIYKGDKFSGGRVYRGLDYTIKPTEKHQTNIRLKFHESDVYERDCPDGIQTTGLNDGMMKTIQIPVPRGFQSDATQFKAKLEMVLSADNIVSVRVIDAKSGKSLRDESERTTMDDHDFSVLDEHQDSLNGDLESLKGHLDSLVRSYEEVYDRCQRKERDYAVLEECAEDYKYALEVLLENYGDLLTLSTDSERSEGDIKKRIQDKLEKMKDLLAYRNINLQYQIPGKQYVKPNVDGPSPYCEYTTDMDLDGVVQKIECIGLNSGNIRGDREIRESTIVYRYRDSSDSTIPDTSAKEGASEAAAPALLRSHVETVETATPRGIVLDLPVEDPRVSDGRASCTVYKGLYNGSGRYTYSDSSYYEGGFQFGLRHGPGCSVRMNEYKITGTWDHDLLSGEASVTSPSGECVFTGVFENGHCVKTTHITDEFYRLPLCEEFGIERPTKSKTEPKKDHHECYSHSDHPHGSPASAPMRRCYGSCDDSSRDNNSR